MTALDIFDGLNLEKFLNFFIKTLSNIDGNSKSLKIETSLMHSKHISAYNDLLELQKGRVIIDNKSSCSICNKGFFNSQISFATKLIK